MEGRVLADSCCRPHRLRICLSRLEAGSGCGTSAGPLPKIPSFSMVFSAKADPRSQRSRSQPIDLTTHLRDIRRHEGIMPEIDWTYGTPSFVAALALGYLLGADPVRGHLHPPRRRRRSARHRLGQYRRHQRAAHRPQGAGGGDADLRRAEGHRRGADRRPSVGATSSRWSPASAPSSAICGRSGSSSRAARASPPISAC